MPDLSWQMIAIAACLLMIVSGCASVVTIPNGTLLRVSDKRPIEVATWDAASKTWIVRGKVVVTGYFADPPLAATTQPGN